MKKRIAVIVTNAGSYRNSDVPTGLWLSELAHFWEPMNAAGFEMDLISPEGGKSPLEPKALKFPMIDKASRAYLNDATFMSRLDNTISAVDANADDYCAIYFTGGHGVMFDFPDNTELQRLTRDIWEQGGVVSAVCHGYCGLLNVKLSDGSYLFAEKTVTGFSWFEEVLSGVAKKVPFNAQEATEERGANYVKSFFPFKSFVQTDGRLVTGQNPGSARETADATLTAIQGLA